MFDHHGRAIPQILLTVVCSVVENLRSKSCTFIGTLGKRMFAWMTLIFSRKELLRNVLFRFCKNSNFAIYSRYRSRHNPKGIIPHQRLSSSQRYIYVATLVKYGLIDKKRQQIALIFANILCFLAI